MRNNVNIVSYYDVTLVQITAKLCTREDCGSPLSTGNTIFTIYYPVG